MKILTIFVLEDCTDPAYMLLRHEKEVDVKKCMKKIHEAAMEAGIECEDDSQIPKSFFTAQGIEKLDARTAFAPKTPVKKEPEYVQAGIHLATCKDCDSFQNGYCTRYGEPAHSNDDCCCHLHGPFIYKVCVDSLEIGPALVLDKEIRFAEFLPYIHHDDFQEIRDVWENWDQKEDFSILAKGRM